MDRTTLTRIAVAAAVPALVFGTPAAAVADSFFGDARVGAGEQGAFSYSVRAYAVEGETPGTGSTYWARSWTYAGPDGAALGSRFSAAYVGGEPPYPPTEAGGSGGK